MSFFLFHKIEIYIFDFRHFLKHVYINIHTNKKLILIYQIAFFNNLVFVGTESDRFPLSCSSSNSMCSLFLSFFFLNGLKKLVYQESLELKSEF